MCHDSELLIDRRAVVRRLVFAVLGSTVAVAASAGAQGLAPAPMTARVGTVLVYRSVTGEVLEDSVTETSTGRVVLVRRAQNAGALTEAPREIRRAADGYHQRDAGGDQLFTPLPWPPSNDWEFTYRGLRYRYTYLGEERVSLSAGEYTAAHLQLAIVGASTTFYDLWLVPNLGIIRRSTRGRRNGSDYELVAVRPPTETRMAQVPGGTLGSPRRSADSSAQTTRGSAAPSAEPASITRAYIAGGGWWFDRELSRRGDETDDVSIGIVGWHVEAGFVGPIGLRARYGEGREEFSDVYRSSGLAPAKVRLASAELLVALWAGRMARLYAGGGAQWSQNVEVSSQQWRPAAIGTVGVDSGVRGAGLSLYSELQWTSGGIPYHVTPSSIEARSGATVLLGLRLH